MGKLFGTDGIRSVANQYPITCELALKIGQAVGFYSKQSGFNAIIIGKDTRISGDMLESALAAGVASTGIDVKFAGIIPTPGVAYLCYADKNIGAGIVVSASHNPYQDNGIKIFKNGGEKLSNKEENKIEDYILNSKHVPQSSIGTIRRVNDSTKQYSRFLSDSFSYNQLDKKLKIIIDCSNGAASKAAHMVFNDKLFDVQFIHDTPDGKNINLNCGSQHIEDLQGLVLKNQADIGLAFDGDADRLIVVDELGNKITGDCILAVCAKYAKEAEKLNKNIVVSTIMSNVGLTKALDTMGIEHIKSDVGDQKVLEAMKKSGAVIGGEDSGHMIFLDSHTTGDGMLSALKLLEVLIETDQSFSELSSVMTIFPQVLMNVEVNKSRPDFTKIDSIADTIKHIEQKLGNKGRVLIRYSGTQPLIRVMVEGPNQAIVEKYCSEICESIKKNL